MTRVRAVTLGIRLLSAGAWAWVLAIVGLWLVLDYAPGFSAAVRWPMVMAGITALGAAQFIFMVGVADRLFPNLARRPGVFLIEMGMVLASFLSGLLAFLVVYWGALL